MENQVDLRNECDTNLRVQFIAEFYWIASCTTWSMSYKVSQFSFDGHVKSGYIMFF